MRSSGWKYLRRASDGAEELYDLEQDPGEQRNLANQDTDRLARLRQRFDVAVKDLAPVAGAGVEELTSDPETLEQLRALGYIDE